MKTYQILLLDDVYQYHIGDKGCYFMNNGKNMVFGVIDTTCRLFSGENLYRIVSKSLMPYAAVNFIVEKNVIPL